MKETSFDNRSVKDPNVTNTWSEEVAEQNNCCRRWWINHSNTERCYCIIAIVLLIVTILMTKILLICCVKAAANILDRLDISVDPCKDFYTFSCGNFIKTNTVPDDHNFKNLLQEMQDEVYIEMKKQLEKEISDGDGKAITEIKLLYMSCMNESSFDDHSKAMQAFVRIFETIGGQWPLVDPSPVNHFDLEYRLASLFLLQVQPFFQLFILPPNKSSNQYYIHMYAGSTVLESTYFTVTDQFNDHQNKLNAYIDLQTNVARIFASFNGIEESELDLNLIRNNIIDMVKLESDLANMTRDIGSGFTNTSLNDDLKENIMSNEENDIHLNNTNFSQNTFISYTFDELEREFGAIKWIKLFNYIFKTARVEKSDILIHSRDYMSELIKLINKYSSNTIDNYLCWTLIARYMPYLGSQFRRMFSEFRSKVPEMSSENGDSNGSSRSFLSRWKECVHVVSEGLHIPATVLYMNSNLHYFQLVKEKIHQILKDIQIAFNQIIDAQDWIDGLNFKQRCKQRTNNITSKIGFPNFLYNKSEVDILYQNLNIDSNDMFISNILKMSKHEIILEVKKLNQAVNPDADWIYHPLIANAFYDPANNNIIIPSGILRYPLISFERPRYLDLATLGVVIGHELAHSMDSESRKYMTTENGSNWWPTHLYKLYKEKAKCFAQQYAEYRVESENEYINGNQTLEENICDFAGLQQAFTAINRIDESIQLPGLTHFTAYQLFFIQYAQVWCEIANEEGIRKSLNDNHSPGKFRANGVLVNMPQFSNAFKCPKNSPMNPSFKCNLWASNFTPLDKN